MTRLEHIEQLEEARKLWDESERILDILRTQSAKPLKDPSNEEILQWRQQNMN